MKTLIKKQSINQLLGTVFLYFIVAFFAQVEAQNNGCVLIAAEESTIEQVNIVEIRRVYLGLPAATGVLINQPAINVTDIKTYKQFLKNIMHMTENGYQRKTVKRIFRQGGKKIRKIENTDELIKFLNANPLNVSFMNKEDAKKTKGIRVVQVLW